MPRRSKGRGYLRLNEARQRYEAILVVEGEKFTRTAGYTNERGRGAAKRRAEGLLDELRAKHLEADLTDETVAAYLERWLAFTEDRVRPLTFTGYDVMVRKHIIPVLGRKVLADIEARDIDAFMTALSQQGRSPQLVARARKILGQALKRAEVWGAIARNPVAHTEPPRQPNAERASLSPLQAQAFLDSVAGDRLEALWYLAACLGLRSGELRGLRWSDVHADELRIEVGLTYERVRDGDAWTHQYTLGETKTARSRRTIPLPDFVALAIEEHRERQRFEEKGPAWHNAWDLVFTRRYTGDPLSAYGVSSRLKVLLARAGLPIVSLHALRHSSASLLLARSVPPRTVQAILGHSTPNMTLGLYGHVHDAERRSAARALEDWRSGADKATHKAT